MIPKKYKRASYNGHYMLIMLAHDSYNSKELDNYAFAKVHNNTVARLAWMIDVITKLQTP